MAGDMVGEIWKPVPGYDGRYEVSNLGMVRSWCVNGHPKQRLQVPKILRPSRKRRGYLELSLSNNNKKKYKKVNVLVIEAFVGAKPTKKHECAHNDGNPSNNKLENLRWATSKENSEDMETHGTRPRGDRHGCAKLTTQQVLEIISIRKDIDAKLIAPRYGVSPSTINRVRSRQLWKHILPEVKHDN